MINGSVKWMNKTILLKTVIYELGVKHFTWIVQQKFHYNFYIICSIQRRLLQVRDFTYDEWINFTIKNVFFFTINATLMNNFYESQIKSFFQHTEKYGLKVFYSMNECLYKYYML